MIKKVSIIIPTYKRANYLKRAIDSVLMQSYENIEIIVVDDNDSNSVDRKNNEELMEEYKKNKKIIYIKHKKNKNGAAARNTGLKIASGDYITFLDDDDFFLKDRIKILVYTLESNLDYDCAYSSMIVLRNGKITKYNRADKKGNLIVDLLKCKSIFGTGSNMFFRKSAIDKIGFFDERFARNQDIEYIIRFFKFGKVINVDQLLVVKCNDDRSNMKNFQKMLEVKNLFFLKFKNIIENNKEKNNIYYKNYESLLYFSVYDRNNFKLVKKMLNKYGQYTFKMKLKVLYLKYMQKNKIINYIYYKKLEFIASKNYTEYDRKQVQNIYNKKL